jgi:F-box-like
MSWLDLPYDVLGHITSFLDLPDYHRFSAVCADWRSAAIQTHYSSTPQVPWLVLGEDNGAKKRNFYMLSEGRHFSNDIPELHGRYICGSSYGWLFAIDIKLDGILINPLS